LLGIAIRTFAGTFGTFIFSVFSMSAATPVKSAQQTPAKTPAKSPDSCGAKCGSCGKLKFLFGFIIISLLGAIGGGYGLGKIDLCVAGIAAGAVIGLAIIIAIIGKFACKSKGTKAKSE
jgi:hypothetical protein